MRLIYGLRCWLAKKLCNELIWDSPASQLIDELTIRTEKTEEENKELREQLYQTGVFIDD